MSITENVKRLSYEMGFDLVSVSRAEPLERDRLKYQEWKEKGYAAGLQYMIREEPRRWVPQDLLPEARSVITFGVNFFSGIKNVETRRGYGRVARYAWGKDYHEVVRDRLEEWVERLVPVIGRRAKTKILADSSPLLEKAFAYQGGMGFVGKNTLLISRKMGSFLFLSEVLTDLELEPDVSKEDESKDACGACKECLVKCPTNALVAPRQLDARKCISYWTIENKGEIPLDMRPGIGDWIFGCDICQEVCPYNGLAKETLWKELHQDQGAGPHLSLLEILSMKTDEEFKKRFAGSPIMRAKRFGLMRNACIVAGNQKFKEAGPVLEELVKNGDPLLKDHAEWALAAISSS
ncbi:MAG: tRNA epoxyqueuosine(34) reductase QueG [Elusimicrobia bacterium RIFCSPLOWO2_01_FULL_54_10]|nr:MAG: tRNA epoxyqueuosine(34) reductase QueG [Elusimicrobia bacterium RIFCSPLOWO2_01_FULL_54_10]